MTETGMKILLGDDHTVVRQGLRKILEDCPGWQVVGEAADGRSAVRMALEVCPHVAILDISMPLLNGIDATRQIRRRQPDVGVVILSMHTEESFITTAVQAGARGYVLKESADTELIRGVAAVARGESFLSPEAAEATLNDYVRHLNEKGIVDRYDALSEREREILQLIAESHSNKDVAELLSISPATVETHRAHILQKLDLHSTAQLVRYAVRRGMVS
jgi:DNA-binding NarL/FixJ family response regulator